MKKLLLLLSFVFSCQLAYGAPADMAVTPAGAGDGTGTKVDGVTLEWDNAMSEAQFETDIEGSAEAGDRYFVAGGTYTLDSGYSATNDGTTALPIKIIGVDSGTTAEPPTTADWATGTNRPFFDTTANDGWTLAFDNYWHFYNLRADTEATSGFNGDTGCLWYNVKVDNQDGDAGSIGITVGASSRIINCEAQSVNGEAMQFESATSMAIGCYIHDSPVGIDSDSNAVTVINSIIDTCTVGFQNTGTTFNVHLVNNTFYNCTTGVALTAIYNHILISNIFDGCTTEASNSAASTTEYVDYNCWDPNPTVTNIVQGPNKVELDPGLTDPGNGDFTLGSGSACLDAGFQMGPNEGLKAGVNTKWNIGQDQDDVAAVGGGGTAGAVSVGF